MGDALLRARADAVLAAARRRQNGTAAAVESFERALASDPGVLRRLSIPLPTRVEGAAGEMGERVAEAIERSPRFDAADNGFIVQVDADAVRTRVCLLNATSTLLGCGMATPEPADSPRAARAAGHRCASRRHLLTTSGYEPR